MLGLAKLMQIDPVRIIILQISAGTIVVKVGVRPLQDVAAGKDDTADEINRFVLAMQAVEPPTFGLGVAATSVWVAAGPNEANDANVTISLRQVEVQFNTTNATNATNTTLGQMGSAQGSQLVASKLDLIVGVTIGLVVGTVAGAVVYARRKRRIAVEDEERGRVAAVRAKATRKKKNLGNLYRVWIPNRPQKSARDGDDEEP